MYRNPSFFLSVMIVASAILFSCSTGYVVPSTVASNINTRSPTKTTTNSMFHRRHSFLAATNLREENESPSPNNQKIWSPKLRRVMGGVASLGTLETAFLTYTKLTGQISTICGTEGTCSDVLTGPYSNVPFTDIPLAALGFVAYATVAGLALAPVLRDDVTNDDGNRVALTAATTAMGTFSIYLMTLLFGVLQTNCPYCVFSATCSIVLAKLAWIGGCLPEGSKAGGKAAGSSFLATTVAALVLFATVDDSVADGTSTFLAMKNGGETTMLYSPPKVLTESSDEALKLARDLKSLDARMYGAYWCSHCYDQKELFGKQAYTKYIDYVECSKDGVDSQSKLCKEKQVPGYPTWEIKGKLYPGQQELDELEEIVKEIQANAN